MPLGAKDEISSRSLYRATLPLSFVATSCAGWIACGGADMKIYIMDSACELFWTSPSLRNSLVAVAWLSDFEFVNMGHFNRTSDPNDAFI